MCGIAGLIGLDHTDGIRKAMMQSILHRGPDENGEFVTAQCVLLHSRLSIIDPDGGKQPMELHWNNEVYTMVYNGELYNTAQLRRELELLGHTFLGHSDTEVLLHGYVQWGEAVLDKANGIFAFAVWHHKQMRLFLARDRMGVKPLFYMLHRNGLLFGSEIKAILSYPSVRPEVDAQGITQLLMLGPGRVPGSGVFYGINELEPGCCGCYSQGRWHWRRYWKLKDREHTDSFEETAEKVRYYVESAIRAQMVSDAPVGTFLSGGLDSSIISSICAKEMGNDNLRLKTFSVDYKNNDKYFVPGKFQPDSDKVYIEIMRHYLDTEHYNVELTPEILVEIMPEATNARDLPGMADVDFSLCAFCKYIRPRVKTALSGECADEIFGGYPWYRDPQIRDIDGFPWSQNIKQRRSYLNSWVTELCDPIDYIHSHYRKTIEESDILPGVSSQEKRMKQMVNLNQRWFMQTLLDRKDRMSMNCGLEVRVPFCDHSIAEYLYGVPWEFKDYQGREKGLLRYAMKSWLPERVLQRKKSPYPKTFDPWYTQIVSARLRDLLNKNDSPILQIVKKQALTDLLDAEYEWPWYGQLMKVPQTIAYMLQLNYWMEFYSVQLRDR